MFFVADKLSYFTTVTNLIFNNFSYLCVTFNFEWFDNSCTYYYYNYYGYSNALLFYRWSIISIVAALS